MRPMYRRVRGRRIVLFILIGIVAVFAFGNIVMFLWNNALAPAINIQTVTFWQALGILVLSKILFSSFGGGRRSRNSWWQQRMQYKWNNLTPEEKEKFKEQWKDNWCRTGQKPWESPAEGEAKERD